MSNSQSPTANIPSLSNGAPPGLPSAEGVPAVGLEPELGAGSELGADPLPEVDPAPVLGAGVGLVVEL